MIVQMIIFFCCGRNTPTGFTSLLAIITPEGMYIYYCNIFQIIIRQI